VPRRYDPEFRRKVLDLLKAGRSMSDLARDLQISDQTIYNWRHQHLIGLELVGSTTAPFQVPLGNAMDWLVLQRHFVIVAADRLVR
jgi:putative transposase